MQRSMWKIFVLLAIVMTFGFAQTSWGGDRICQDDPLLSVEGTISIPVDPAYTDRDCWQIDALVICGVPDYLRLEEGDYVVFEYDERTCGETVACSVTYDDDGTLVDVLLRPQKNKKEESDIIATVVSGVCDCSNCGKNCVGEDCVMTCNCYCEDQ